MRARSRRVYCSIPLRHHHRTSRSKTGHDSPNRLGDQALLSKVHSISSGVRLQIKLLIYLNYAATNLICKTDGFLAPSLSDYCELSAQPLERYKTMIPHF
jgi:hypothetical protein